jgi:von Willebrand factor type A domain
MLLKLIAGTIAIFLPFPISGVTLQQPSCVSRTVPMNVVNANGIQAGQPEGVDLEARVGSKRANIISVSKDSHPRRVVILLDASGSMSGETEAGGKWTLALRVAGEFVSDAPESETVSLIVFAGEILNTVGFSEDRNAILNELKKLAPGFKALSKKANKDTALWDAISAGADMLGPSNSGDVIYAITDGGDNESKERAGLAERKLIERQIRLFGFFFYDEAYQGSSYSNAGDVIRMVHATGGSSAVLWPSSRLLQTYDLTSDRLAKLDQSVQLQIAKIGKYYRVEIVPASNGNKSERLSLTFSHPNDPKWRDAQLSYPHRIPPCS